MRTASAEEQQYRKKLNRVEVAAKTDPVGTFLELFEFTDRQRLLYMRYARLRFGVEVRATEGDAQAFVTKIVEGGLQIVGRGPYKPIDALAIVRPQRWPRNLGEQALLINLLCSYALADFTRRAMIEIGWSFHEAGYDVEDMDWVMCQVFLRIHRNRFVFLGVLTEQGAGFHRSLREEATERLAGLLASKISLNRNKRLSAALARRGQKPFDALLEELPAAALVGWGNARREGSLKDFEASVTRSLEELGSEAAIRPDKVLDELHEQAGRSTGNAMAGEDEDLAEFERNETLRQQSSQLQCWVEKAQLSTHERRVYELDMMNLDTKAIAQQMAIAPSTVRQYRKRYTNKIRRAAGL